MHAEMMGDDTARHVPVLDTNGCRQQAIDVRHFETGVGERCLRCIGLQLERRTIRNAADTAFADTGNGSVEIDRHDQSVIFTPRSRSRVTTMRWISEAP